MKIREHVFVVGKCLYCGAKEWSRLVAEAKAAGAPGEPNPDQRTCLERDDYAGKDLRPEPARRQYACEDAVTIALRLTELAADRRGRCPVTGRDLYGCLHSSARCGESCPDRELWTGPAVAG